MAASSLAEAPTAPPMVRLLAARAVELGGMTCGQALEGLNDLQVSELLGCAVTAQHDADVLMWLCVCCLMLANGEGLPVAAEDSLSRLVRNFALMLQAEQLLRRGLVAYDRRRLSLEHFDVEALSLTAQARQQFGGIEIRQKSP